MVESIRRVRFASHCIASHCVRIWWKVHAYLRRFASHMVESVFEDTKTRSGKVRTHKICNPFCSGLYGKAQPVHNRGWIAI